jgi:hypothetical protein
LSHDISAFASGLSAKLATRSRHVCVFLGAGSSRACGLPDVAALQTMIAEKLLGEQREAFLRLTAARNLEEALSRLRRIHSIAENDDLIDGLLGSQAADLDFAICRIIVEELSTTNVDLGPVQSFALWASRADYVKPVEVFTVNYDLLVESAFEEKGSPYFDGFVGSMQARFRTDMVEASSVETDVWLPAFYTRLWKLHGSVNWAWEQEAPEGQVIRLGSPVPVDGLAAIFPSDAKYEESRRMPFVVLQDRFRRALNEPETMTLVSGYSWADDHLNELLFDAAARRPRSEIVAFCYSQIPPNLAAEAMKIPNLQVITDTEAILGGVRAAWSGPTSGSSTPLPEDVWKDGRSNLGDFRQLAKFLARSSSNSVLPSRTIEVGASFAS